MRKEKKKKKTMGSVFSREKNCEGGERKEIGAIKIFCERKRNKIDSQFCLVAIFGHGTQTDCAKGISLPDVPNQIRKSGKFSILEIGAKLCVSISLSLFNAFKERMWPLYST